MKSFSLINQAKSRVEWQIMIVTVDSLRSILILLEHLNTPAACLPYEQFYSNLLIQFQVSLARHLTPYTQ